MQCKGFTHLGFPLVHDLLHLLSLGLAHAHQIPILAFSKLVNRVEYALGSFRQGKIFSSIWAEVG